MGVTREPSVAVVTRASPGTAANVGAVRSSAQPWLHRVAATVLTVAALRLLYTLSLAERLGSDASLIGTIGGMTTSFLVALGAYGASKWTPPTVVRWRVIAGVYLTWWAVVLFALKANPVTAARSDVLATALFFRSFDSPVATLSIGLVAQSVVLLMVASPLLRNLASRVRLGAGAFAGVGGLALHALLAAWQSGPAGWHSTIFGQLPLVVGGVAAAALEPHVRHAHRLAGGLVALVAIAVAALALPDPLRLDGSVERTLFLALAAVASTATLVGLSLDRTGVRGTAGSFPWWAAVATLCAADACAVVVARQYRERYVGSADLPVLNGRVIAPALWAAGAAVCIGVLIAAGGAVIRSARRRTLPALATHSMTLPTLLAGAFAVRLATLLTVAPERTDQGDPFFYHVTANALAAGKGFVEPFNWVAYGDPIPSAFHGPLYPMVLSISSRLGGTDYFDHKMASVVIGTALIGAVFVLARRLAGPWVAVVAASFAAVYPNLWLIDSLLYPEGLMALLVTLSIIVMYKWLDAPKVTTAVMLGALIALAALARGEGVLLGPLMAMPMMLRQRSLPLGIRWRHLVLAGLACVATLAPWMIRNTMRFDNFVPLSNNGNEVMVYSNCATAYDGPLVGYWDYTCQQRIRDEIGNPPGDESDIALYWRDIGFDYARENADELPRVMTLRVLRQWELFRPAQNVTLAGIEGRNKEAGALGLLMYYGLAALTVGGALIMRRRGTPSWPLIAQLVSVTITSAYTYGTIRFRAPAEPVLCVVAAIAAVPLAQRVWTWLRTPAAPVATVPDLPFVSGGRGGLQVRRHGMWQRDAVRTWAGIGAVMFVVAIPLRGLYHTTGGTMEEAFMLVFPERMWQGDMPNRDFLHLYGPGALYVLMGWFKVFGYELGVERTFGLIQHLGIIFGLFTLARPWGRVAATAVAGASVFYILTPIALTAMAWNGGVALVLWSVILALRALHREGRSRRWLQFGAAVLAGLALTYRPDLALALALVYGWYLWRTRDSWRPLLAGVVSGLVPIWLHLAIVGPNNAFRGMFLDPVFELRPGRELPRPPSSDRLDGSLQAIAELIPPWWRFPALRAEQSLFVWFFAMLAAPLLLWWLARRAARAAQPRAPYLMAIALVSIGLIPQALQRPDSTHLSWVTCVSFPMLVVGYVEWRHQRRRFSPLRPRHTAATGLAIVVAVTLVAAPLFTFRYYLLHTRVSIGNVQRPFPTERDGRRFYFGEFAAAAASQQAIDELDALLTPGQSLIVGPADLRRTWYSDVNFYYQFPELEPGTYFIEMDPGLANSPDSPLADELRRTDWLILTRFWDGWYEPNAAMDFGSDEPNEVVRAQFCLVGSYEGGLVELYRRCR
jgi:4-amino-4-deoxy-L-arabinose transferase-like glycosyltransferase